MYAISALVIIGNSNPRYTKVRNCLTTHNPALSATIPKKVRERIRKRNLDRSVEDNKAS